MFIVTPSELFTFMPGILKKWMSVDVPAFSYFLMVTIRPVTILVLQQFVNNDTTLMEVEHKPQ